MKIKHWLEEEVNNFHFDKKNFKDIWREATADFFKVKKLKQSSSPWTWPIERIYTSSALVKSLFQILASLFHQQFWKSNILHLHCIFIGLPTVFHDPKKRK